MLRGADMGFIIEGALPGKPRDLRVRLGLRILSWNAVEYLSVCLITETNKMESFIMKQKALKAVLAVSALMMGMGNAQAESEWKHTLVPLYLWASGIEGTSQIGPVSAPVSIKFEDAIDNLDSGLTVHYEANKDQWGVLVDIFHLSLAPEGLLPNGATAGVDLTNNIYELGGVYRPSSMNGAEVLFGLRGIDLEMEAGIGGAPKRTLIDDSWVDAFVGLRGTASLSNKVSLVGRGDVGAGGSDFVWNAALLLDYRFNKNFSMFGGYRWLGYDYETGSGPDYFSYDVTYEGPAIALRFDW